MTDIKAIETRYKGYRFRSRLEARWAVFFDAIGMKWEYEVEGFDLGVYGWYLPDFWLPEIGVWVEIKGNWSSTSISDGLEKSRIFTEITGQAILFCEGLPDNYKMTLFSYGETEEHPGDFRVYSIDKCWFGLYHHDFKEIYSKHGKHNFMDGFNKMSYPVIEFVADIKDAGFDYLCSLLEDDDTIHERLVKANAYDISELKLRGPHISLIRASRLMSPRLDNAYDAARSARFEFDERK